MNNGRTHHLTAVSEKDLVLVPPASAEPLLRAFFAGNGAHSVIAAIERVHKPNNTMPCYTIHWESDGGGSHPAFDGELMVAADENFNGFWLVLTGAYIPPGGTAGHLFDVALGSRIARSTARTLLREMRVEIEALHHTEVQNRAISA